MSTSTVRSRAPTWYEEQISFLQGVFIGIYGNWIVGLVTSFSFSTDITSIIVLEFVCLSLCLVTLGVYFVAYTGMFSYIPQSLKTPSAYVHVTSLIAVSTLEIINVLNWSLSAAIQRYFFLCVGIGLWFFLTYLNNIRHKIGTLAR